MISSLPDTKWVHTFETETMQASSTTVYFQNAASDYKSNVLVAFIAHLIQKCSDEGWLISTGINEY